MHTVDPGIGDYPTSMPIRQTAARIQDAFPGGPMPAQVVIKASDIHTPAVSEAIRQFRTQALATGLVHDPVSLRYVDRHVAIVSAPLAGNGRNAVSDRALTAVRERVIPATLATAPGVQTVAVGGQTASSTDLSETLRTNGPLVFLFVLGLAFALLLVTFRSIVIPLRAIILNLLSVGAAYGFPSPPSNGAGASTSSASGPPVASRPGSRCSCSSCSSASPWITTCSCSAASAKPSTAA
jgi:predicted RND superfamily exporter protein